MYNLFSVAPTGLCETVSSFLYAPRVVPKYRFILLNCSFPNPNPSLMSYRLQIMVYRNGADMRVRLGARMLHRHKAKISCTTIELLLEHPVLVLCPHKRIRCRAHLIKNNLSVWLRTSSGDAYTVGSQSTSQSPSFTLHAEDNVSNLCSSNRQNSTKPIGSRAGLVKAIVLLL